MGYDVEVAQNIAQRLGVEVSFAEGEWDGLLAGLDSGRYDIMVNGVDIDEARSEKYDFSTPYAFNRTAVIVSGDNDSIQSMEDLNGKSTANTLNSTYANVAESYGAEVTGVPDPMATPPLWFPPLRREPWLWAIRSMWSMFAGRTSTAVLAVNTAIQKAAENVLRTMICRRSIPCWSGRR